MELIDDWMDHKPSATAKDFGHALRDFEPQPLRMHCYDDVRHPWIQITFEHPIAPDVALRLGEALAAVPGAATVYFNSLRPRAVYFLIESSVDKRPDLPASRYGATVAEMRQSWT